MARKIQPRSNYNDITIIRVTNPIHLSSNRLQQGADKQQYINRVSKLRQTLDRRALPTLQTCQRTAFLQVVDHNETIRKRYQKPDGSVDLEQFDPDDLQEFQDAEGVAVDEKVDGKLASFQVVEPQCLRDRLKAENIDKPVKHDIAHEKRKPTNAVRYAKMVDTKPKANIDKVGRGDTQDLEEKAKVAMKAVSLELQGWVTEVLDNSMKLDPQVLEHVKTLGPQGGAGETAAYEQTLLALERVDISGFNVLLNACKPSILEAKPPVRLNVMNDAMPGGAKSNSNITQSKDAAKPKKKAIVISNPEPCVNRLDYGVWYIDPKGWAKTMREKQKMKNSQGTDYSKPVGGLVQQKLDEINSKRIADREQMFRELEKLEEEGNQSKGTSAKPAVANLQNAYKAKAKAS